MIGNVNHPAMSEAPINPGFVDDLLGKLEEIGGDTQSILDQVGLTRPVTRPLTNELFGHMWHLVALAMKDEFIGHGDRAMRPGSYALMCHAALSTRNLEHALKRCLTFLNVTIDAPVGRLETEADDAQIVLTDSRRRDAFAYRTYWLILMGVACWLIGRRIPLRQVDFACPAPPQRQAHLQFFGAPVHFDTDRSRLSFAASYLKLPVIRDDAALRPFLEKAPGNILSRFKSDPGVAGQVRAHLARLSPRDWPDFNELSDLFGLSPATLRRRLRADGQTYGSIKEERRLAVAQTRLDSGAVGIAAIAEELGYSEPSAFSRAYRTWTGRSPRGR